jgi:8-oxo-dGTP pyrophosphatase MutT (NUDIX family)
LLTAAAAAACLLKDLTIKLKHRLSLPLPGKDAQLLMAHLERRINLAKYNVPQDARWGSVLILLYEDNNVIKFPLILRSTYEGVHSGQVGLPGGKFEAADETLVNTALREANEEIGIVKQDVEPIGALTELYIPPSNFLVHPHLAKINYTPQFIPDPHEVVKVIEVSLDDLANELFVKEKEITLSNGLKILTPYFDLYNYTVWGATAMILSELKTVMIELGY